MAVDSLAKRASAHRAASWPGRVLPIPDSTVAAADRAHVEGFYGGLFAEVLPAARNALGPDAITRHLGPDTVSRHLGPE